MHADPRCCIVTGLPGAGKTRWLREQIGPIVLMRPPAQVGLLQLEQGRTRIDPRKLGWPPIRSRLVLSPCTCCPPPLDLAGLLAEWSAPPEIDWLFVEVPALAFVSWITAFNRDIHRPRKVVVCTGRISARQQENPADVPYFLTTLLSYADEVVSVPR